MHSFELTGLKATTLIAVKRKMTDSPKKSFRSCWSHKRANSWHTLTINTWHERKKFNFWSNFSFMCKQLKLSDVHWTLKLQNQLLWINAEPLTLPALRLGRVTLNVCQLCHDVIGVLTWAMENTEGQYSVIRNMGAYRLSIRCFWFFNGFHLKSDLIITK